ncbi:MAG: hypothetical protein ACI4LB_09540 [Candidatus Fimenecus sp.]
MQKKILAVALAMLLFVFGAVACGKKDKIEEDSTYAPFEYTTDEAGERYITNIYGDLIPVTTTASGEMELMEDLVTKTKEQAEQEKAEQESEKNNPQEPAGDSGVSNGDSGNSGGNNSGSSSNGGIVIGSDDVKNNNEHDAVIVW